MSRFLSTTHPLRAAAALLAAATLAACADKAPTAPSAAPAAAWTTTSGSTLVSATTLRRTTALRANVTRSVTLDRTGGKLAIPEAGLTIVIPANALPTSPMTITATAYAGTTVAYDFQPHGTRFLAPVRVQQALSGTSWDGNTGRMQLEGGYYANDTQLDRVAGTAQLSELFPVTLSGGVASFTTPHFSGYIVATGRK